jgi:hypothetical protein
LFDKWQVDEVDQKLVPEDIQGLLSKPLLEYSDDELVTILPQFIGSLKRDNGSEYKGGSIFVTSVWLTEVF